MPTFAKALVGGLASLLSSLAVLLVGDVGFADLTDGQWVTVALATLTSVAAVWGVPNGKSQDPTLSTPGPDRGRVIHPHDHDDYPGEHI